MTFKLCQCTATIEFDGLITVTHRNGETFQTFNLKEAQEFAWEADKRWSIQFWRNNLLIDIRRDDWVSAHKSHDCLGRSLAW